MNNLERILHRDFPAFEALRACEAGIPSYFIRIWVEVLEAPRLSSFEDYFLRAVALGVKTREAIAHLLGVDERDLLSPGATLLKLEYIEQNLLTIDGERPIILTDLGRQAVSEQGPPPVPRRKYGHMHFNALTWTPTELEQEAWPIERMGKEGLFILPSQTQARPTLGDFTEKSVEAVLTRDSAFREKTVIALIELAKVELTYIAPVTVVLLRHRETGEQRITIYRGGIGLQMESTAAQRLFEAGQLTLPNEAESLKERTLSVPVDLPVEVSQITRELVQNEYALKEIEAQLRENEGQRTTTQNDRERQSLEQRIQHVKEELRIKREENEELRERLRETQVEFLRTEQHRPVLEQALREAKQEIIIISPWMNRRACNDSFCRLIGDAMKRGVHIRIGYGMGRERDANEAARNRANVNAVKTALERQISPSLTHHLELRETSGTHQKILICDRTFAVTGSFNWLSYVGGQDEGYRNEIGAVFRQAGLVKDLATIALRVLVS